MIHFSDMEIILDGNERLPAHKFVLNACSPVFQSITEDLAQSENPVLYMRGISTYKSLGRAETSVVQVRKHGRKYHMHSS